LAPDYLAGDCQLVADSGRRSLRSAERRVCTVPRQNSTFGNRSFAAAGPRAWNELPFSLRDTGLSLTTFNARLKTYLFSTAFEARAHLWHLLFLCAAYKRTYLLYLLTYLPNAFFQHVLKAKNHRLLRMHVHRVTWLEGRESKVTTYLESPTLNCLFTLQLSRGYDDD